MNAKKLNIAIFSPSQNPYSETFIQAHKKYLKGKVFYYYGTKGSIKLEGKGQLKVTKIKKLQLRFTRKLYKKPFSYISDQVLLQSLKKNNIGVVLVEYGLHAHSLREVLKASGLPVVVHFHGFDASIRQVIKSCNNYKEVFSLATTIIAVSKKMEQMLLELGCPKEKLIYNVYGPQPEFSKIAPTFSKKQFIAIGRFTNKKAPYYTILAFKEVLKTHPDATLLMAGDGELLNTCKNLISLYRLENNIKLIGIITPETYRELLTESLAFVQHSITAANGDMEGTPVSILEASAAGLPVISTHHAGIPDVIIHEETGLLCDEHDVEAMANNMKRVLDDVNFAKQLGQNGKEHIKQNFSMERHIDKLQEVLITVSKKE